LSDSTTFHANVSYSAIGGGYAEGGTQILDADPMFVGMGAGDYHLQATSPCIDSGAGVAAPPNDFEKEPRVDIPWIENTGDSPPWADIGAFENDGSKVVWTAMTGGTYPMGSVATEGDTDEEPQHDVTVPGFDITATEVTTRQYRACVLDSVCTEPSTDSGCNWDVGDKAFDPVNCVSFGQAVDFCSWVGIGGRLATESEWEYAARGMGQNVTYPWGEPVPVADNLAVMSGSSCDGTCPVCSEPDGKTAQGLCDMAGNVWEWVEDWFHPSYEYSSYTAPIDGSAWLDPVGTERVMRGGSYGNTAWDLRTRNRANYDPAGYSYLGFRCAR
ncbi:MAG: SUMF1/EgtB/PvdO family nonheme iron enzyme, partial [Deltaproteobacteria bacterium]|nr:SUMF1/EgtB/PvdO family nonheme iron enzyme [Deltaproteobacteria bacterium]